MRRCASSALRGASSSTIATSMPPSCQSAKLVCYTKRQGASSGYEDGVRNWWVWLPALIASMIPVIMNGKRFLCLDHDRQFMIAEVGCGDRGASALGGG